MASGGRRLKMGPMERISSVSKSVNLIQKVSNETNTDEIAG
jgi:hypothetical protein